MKKRNPFLTAFSILAILILVVGIASVVYLNTLFNLLDRTEITGDPTIAESDLADPEDREPLPTESTTKSTTAATENHPSTESEQPAGSQSTAESSVPDESESTSGTTETTAVPTETTGEAGSTQSITESSRPLTFEEQFPIPNDPGVYNILLIGVDTRAEGFGGRSDSMIILSINKRTHKIHMVSLARNLLVRIEGHENSMLNYAYSWGGVKLLLQTINDNFRLNLSDYLVINFSGFKKAIDYCGGVDIRLTKAEVDYMYLAFPSGSFKVGSNHLNGEQTLVYARIRWIDSDYSRTGRQRKVLDNLIYKLKRKTPAQLNTLMTKVLPLMRTNLSKTTAIELAVGALQYQSYPISQLMLPIAGTNTTVMVRGTQMISYDGIKNVTALHQFLYQD